MDQLQQLHGELDVAQTTLAEFDLPVHLLGRDVFLDAAAHGLDIIDEVLPVGRRPHEIGHGVDVAGTEMLVAGGGPGLQQGLELPGLCPFAVVRHVGINGADQRTRLALGAQGGIHLPDRSLTGGGVGDLHQTAGDLLAGAHRHVDAHMGRARLTHEDHIHVGDVVQLGSTRLAHGDDRQIHLLGLVPHVAHRDPVTGFQRGVRKFCQLGHGDLECCLPRQVPRGHAEQLPAVGDADIQNCRVTFGGRQNPLTRSRGVVGGHRITMLGMAPQEVPERLRGPEQGQQPGLVHGIGQHCLAHRAVERDLGQHPQRPIRVGCQGEVAGIQHGVQPRIGQCVNPVQRKRNVGETHPHQVGLQACAARTHRER